MQLIPWRDFLALGEMEKTNISTNCIDKCWVCECVCTLIVFITTFQVFFYDKYLKSHEIKLNHD